MRSIIPTGRSVFVDTTPEGISYQYPPLGQQVFNPLVLVQLYRKLRWC